MQTITRPFWHRATEQDDEAPLYGQRAKSHWIIRMLVFIVALAVGWGMAMGMHQMILWLHHPSSTDTTTQFHSFIERGIQMIRSTFAG